MKRNARLLSFFGVLLITSALIAFLFQGARAVEIEIDPIAETRASSGPFDVVVTITVPEGQRLPIEHVTAYLEESSSADKASPALVAEATCDSDSCIAAADTLDATGGKADAFVSIVRSGVDASEYGYGYLFAEGTGYGYDALGGYGYEAFDYAGDDGYGYGYGYGDGDASFVYTVRIDPRELGSGHYFLSLSLETGSDLVGEIGSADSYFRVRPAGGGSNSPGSGGDSSAGGIPAGATTPTVSRLEGVTHAQAVLSSIENGRARIALANADARLGDLVLDFGAGATSATVDVRVSDTPFEGASAIPTGFGGGFLYLDIDVAGGGSSGGSLDFTLTNAQMRGNAPETFVWLHEVNGKWLPEQTVVKSRSGGGVTFTATWSNGFSPFAVVSDETDPTITDLRPAANATAGARPLIGASLADNRGIDTAGTSMTIDGQAVAATVSANEVLYTPSVALTAGTHTVVVTVKDLSGRTATSSWSFTTTAAADATAPTVTAGAPADGAFTNVKRPEISATFSDDVGITVGSVTMALDGETVAATATATGVTFTPAADLTDGEHTVRVSVADSSGNGNFVSWTFTVDTALPTFGEVSPADGATTQLARPTIEAEVADALSGVQTVTMTVDGQAVQATLVDGVATYVPGADLAAGAHTVKVDATDSAGNTATKSWSFTSAESAVVEGSAGMPGWIWVLIGLVVIGAIVALVMRKK